MGVESPTISWAQLIKGGAHVSPFAALSFPYSKKVPIFCWVNRESFPVAAWRSRASNSRDTTTFCAIAELFSPLDHGASPFACLYSGLMQKCYMDNKRPFTSIKICRFSLLARGNIVCTHLMGLNHIVLDMPNESYNTYMYTHSYSDTQINIVQAPICKSNYSYAYYYNKLFSMRKISNAKYQKGFFCSRISVLLFL